MALMNVNFFSEALGMCVEMNAVIPQRANGIIGIENNASGDTYKTLYLLHGMSDNHTIWLRRTNIERYAEQYGIAVIMPTTHLGFYTDMFNGLNYYTFIAKELPQICRSFFKGMSDKREDNFVAGLSMGGYGALKIALGEPETFSKCAAFSGVLDIASISRSQYETSDFYMNVFGPYDRMVSGDDNLMNRVKKLAESDKPKPDIYIWCGEQDSLLNHNIAMKAELEKYGFNLTYSQSEGNHAWQYWDEHILKAIRWMLNAD